MNRKHERAAIQTMDEIRGFGPGFFALATSGGELAHADIWRRLITEESCEIDFICDLIYHKKTGLRISAALFREVYSACFIHAMQ